jgi:hypothetical protein
MIKRKRFGMPAAGYFVIASIINKIEDAEVRKQVADHFATEFNKRSSSFDAYTWNRATGGQPAPNSAKMS